VEQANTFRAGGWGKSFVVSVRRLTGPIEIQACLGLPGMLVDIDEENVTDVFGMHVRKVFRDTGFCPLSFECTSFKKWKPFKCTGCFPDAPFG
jgi:hypothetical protein